MSHPPYSTVGGPTEESGAHQAHRSGFAFSGEEVRIPGVPAERRPLSRRAIRTWTIGSVVGTVLLASVVAVAFSKAHASEQKAASAQMGDAVPAQPAVAPPATARPPVVPLEALPIAKDEPQPVASAAPKTRARRAGKPAEVARAEKRSTTADSSPARGLRAKTVTGIATTTATKTSVP